VFKIQSLAFYTVLGLLTALPANAADPIPIDEFLTRMRSPVTSSCWAHMKGRVQHKDPASGKKLKAVIELRARFTSTDIMAQLVFNDKERYLLGQNYADGAQGTSVIEQVAPAKGDDALHDIGIRPSDLTLSFLFWEFAEELKSTSVSGQKCRVLRLKHPKADETAVVSVSTEYLFPLEVEWYKGDETTSYRKLEFDSLKKMNGFWLVTEVNITGGSWKTGVKFSNNKVEALSADAPLPKELFLK
jgi:hypothetical protein